MFGLGFGFGFAFSVGVCAVNAGFLVAYQGPWSAAAVVVSGFTALWMLLGWLKYEDDA